VLLEWESNYRLWLRSPLILLPPASGVAMTMYEISKFEVGLTAESRIYQDITIVISINCLI
jgi:hypothetical protein